MEGIHDDPWLSMMIYIDGNIERTYEGKNNGYDNGNDADNDNVDNDSA